MKGLVNDVVWLKGPDGGEVKMSMGGYPPKEVERLKWLMIVGGWEVVSHETTTHKKWELPSWVIPYCVGVLVSAAGYWFINR